MDEKTEVYFGYSLRTCKDLYRATSAVTVYDLNRNPPQIKLDKEYREYTNYHENI